MATGEPAKILAILAIDPSGGVDDRAIDQLETVTLIVNIPSRAKIRSS